MDDVPVPTERGGTAELSAAVPVKLVAVLFPTSCAVMVVEKGVPVARGLVIVLQAK